jgi:hypothetical protein
MPTIPYRSGFYGLATPRQVAQPLNAVQAEEMAKAGERHARGEVSDYEQNYLQNEVARRALGLRAMSSDGGK